MASLEVMGDVTLYENGTPAAVVSGTTANSTGISTPANNNLIASHSHTGTVDKTIDITSYGGSVGAKWGIFVIAHTGSSFPNHETWVSHDAQFSTPNRVFLNQSDKAQAMHVQFLAPVDSAGKCYVRNIEGSADPWQLFYMGSI